MKRRYGNLPIDYGVRSAAEALGMDFSWLSRLARRKGSPYAPDRVRIEAGREVPMWSSKRIARIRNYRETIEGDAHNDPESREGGVRNR